jgi:hypothetical protein
MSMQIHVDPAGLTQEQREAVAGFILAYPVAVHKPAEFARVPQFAASVDPVADLARDGDLTDAAIAFSPPGDPAAFAAFGKPAPLPPGAIAPSTADAPLASTAPVAMPFSTNPAPVPGLPAAPPANVAPPAVPPTAHPAITDKRGFPWDARIHAGSRAMVADGTWRKKQKLEQTFVDQVEAELRQLMGAPAVHLAPAAPPAPPNAFASSPMPAGAVAGMPSAAPVPLPPAAAPSSTVDPKLAYVALIGRVAAAVPAGKITQEEVTQCCQQFGVPALPLAGNRLDLIPHIAASVDAIIAARS